MPDWFDILLIILSIFIGGFALGMKYGAAATEYKEYRKKDGD